MLHDSTHKDTTQSALAKRIVCFVNTSVLVAQSTLPDTWSTATGEYKDLRLQYEDLKQGSVGLETFFSEAETSTETQVSRHSTMYSHTVSH